MTPSSPGFFSTQLCCSTFVNSPVVLNLPKLKCPRGEILVPIYCQAPLTFLVKLFMMIP